MRRNEPPFFMMQPMGMMPHMMMDQPQSRVPEIVVPPRVEKALQFLNLLTQKTSPQVAATEHHIEEIKGQQLTDEEAAAQATACQLLNQYFAGKLQPDTWESLKVEAIKRQNRRKKKGIDKRPSSVIHCPMCGVGGRPKKDCPMCSGAGTVFVSPGVPQHDE